MVKLRLTMGLTAARRAAAIAERWRNMTASIDLVVGWYDLEVERPEPLLISREF